MSRWPRPPVLAVVGLVAGTHLAVAQSTAESATEELVDEFQVNCLANLADLNLVRTGARMLQYEPVPPGLLARLNADQAWFLPSEHGELVLGLSATGGCGVIARRAAAAGAAALLRQRFTLEPVTAGPAAGPDKFEYRLALYGHVAIVRVAGNQGGGEGAVAMSVLPGRRVAPTPQGDQPPPPPAGRATAARPPPPPAPPPAERAATAPPPTPPPPAPGWDPDAATVENIAADLFDDVCYRTGNDRQAIERKAATFAWTPIDSEATHRAGFERGWAMRAPAGETLMVFFDSLQPKCCVSAFPARRAFVTAAVGTRYGLEEPRAERAGAKNVLVFRPRDNYQITMDFEEVEGRGTFGSVCYTRL
jgi:hypothetical protein